MVPVTSHEYDYCSLYIEFRDFEPPDEEAHFITSLICSIEGFFSEKTINSLAIINAPAYFKDGHFFMEWDEWGETAEAQGPFILEGQEFTLKGLLEYLAQKYDIEKDR